MRDGDFIKVSRTGKVVNEHLGIVATRKKHVFLWVPCDRVHRRRVAVEGVKRQADTAQV